MLLKRLAATLAGMLAGGLTVALIEYLNQIFYPAPPDLNPLDPEAMRQYARQIPAGAFVTILAAWLLGSFVATCVAYRLWPRSPAPALAAGTIFLLATLLNLAALPHPLWVWVGGLAVCLLGGGAGLACGAPGSHVVETTRRIQAPLSRVFQTLSCPENFSQAVPDITSIEFLGDRHKGPGTRFRETRMINGRTASSVLEITEQVENDRLRILSEAGGAVWDTVFQVEDGGQDVLMSMRMEARPRSLPARILTPMILGMVSQAVEKDMDAVKEYCERA